MYQSRKIDIGSKEIDLYTLPGKFNSFPKKEVQDNGMIENSLMAVGLEKKLTISDLQDLISFLKAHK